MLTDAFNRTIDYLRISVTDRCDLRCIYCIPKGYKDFHIPKEWLTNEEIERVVAAFARLGTQHYRITGGEPLLRKNLSSLIANISAFSGVQDISITTNGTQLSQQAQALYDAGVRRINVSLDSLNSECVQRITGSDSLNKVLKGLEKAKLIGFNKIKINMVLLKNENQKDLEQMIAFCRENHFILCLIEVMPMGKSAQHLQHIDLQNEIEKIKLKHDLLPTTQIIGNGPARYWQNHDGSLIVGLITPLSQHFCQTCNRVRLSVDGTLYTCLGQNDQYPLRPLLRNHCSDEQLEQAIQQAIQLKPEKHNFIEQPDKIIRLMSTTGG